MRVAMELQDILFSQGFGTRRACAALVAGGAVRVRGEACREPARDFAVEGLEFEVDGQAWRWRALAHLMMHKPAGTECSHRPGAWPSVYSLLPAPLRQRPRRGAAPGVQAVGRLDQDTTGLLLFTDDGALIHRLNSPRHQVPKVYEVATVDPVDARLVGQLLAGVRLAGESESLRAQACEASGERSLRLTLTQGKYHQVKRMIAAAGHQVAALHRSRVGALALPPGLAPGQFRWLEEGEVAALRA
jgi:16S rRNA pseudouridine516 synthase